MFGALCTACVLLWSWYKRRGAQKPTPSTQQKSGNINSTANSYKTHCISRTRPDISPLNPWRCSSTVWRCSFTVGLWTCVGVWVCVLCLRANHTRTHEYWLSYAPTQRSFTSTSPQIEQTTTHAQTSQEATTPTESG